MGHLDGSVYLDQRRQSSVSAALASGPMATPRKAQIANIIQKEKFKTDIVF